GARVRLRRPHPRVGHRRHRRRRHGQLTATEGERERTRMNTPTFGTPVPQGLHVPNSRYILPQFEERTAYGYKRQDPYNKLFEDRVIFLGVQVDDASADDVMAQLLVLESQDPDRDIIMYINSPGGSFRSEE